MKGGESSQSHPSTFGHRDSEICGFQGHGQPGCARSCCGGVRSCRAAQRALPGANLRQPGCARSCCGGVRSCRACAARPVPPARYSGGCAPAAFARTQPIAPLQGCAAGATRRAPPSSPKGLRQKFREWPVGLHGSDDEAGNDACFIDGGRGASRADQRGSVVKSDAGSPSELTRLAPSGLAAQA